jgi:hypothetical protein
MNNEFKIGDSVNCNFQDVYVLNVGENKLKILFNDGSCGWHYTWDINNWTHSIFTKWTPEYLKERAEIGFRRGWIDNLTYIELLDRANRNELKPNR